ncbi:heme transporter hrg1-A-like [Clytia hemisphaerica]|uniref:Uncharacterized protein n=1 Tax=Clytia hemisphaerica TaxID=252671 RepID=A0A7M5XII6_9CNID|eukprot:TCONS_00026782-protein
MSSDYRPKGCWLYVKLTTSIIGVVLGLAAFFCFMFVYHNVHSGAWALVSAMFALITFVMHVCVYRDVTYSIQPHTFQRLKYVGIFGAFLGLGIFIGYLVKGILVHESGVVVNGWFIVTVWGYMTWKWGFLLFWHSRKYCRSLVDEMTDILSVNT